MITQVLAIIALQAFQAFTAQINLCRWTELYLTLSVITCLQLNRTFTFAVSGTRIN